MSNSSGGGDGGSGSKRSTGGTGRGKNRGGRGGGGNNNPNGSTGNEQNFPSLLDAFLQLNNNQDGNRNPRQSQGNQRTGGEVPPFQQQPVYSRNGGHQRGIGGSHQQRVTGIGSSSSNQRGTGTRGGGNHTNGRGQSWRNDRDRGNRGRQVVANSKAEISNENEASSSDDENVQAVQRPVKKREKKFEGPVFGFKRLYNFLSTSPDEVLLSINKDKEDWKVLLDSSELDGEKLIVAIQVLGEKVCADIPVLRQQQTNALTACCSQLFVNKVDNALPLIAQGNYIPARRRGNNEFPVDSEPSKVIGNILQFCTIVVKTMPETASDFLHKLITTCMGASIMFDPTMTFMGKFKALNEELVEILQRGKKKEETAKRQRRYGFNEEDEAEFDEETPPDHIGDIEVIPTATELRCRSEQVFLRPNKQTGSYKDSNHYLDVQFRLLREDFVQPLRKGIYIFMKDKDAYLSSMKRMPLGEVRLYTDINFLKVEKERDTIVHKLQLNERNYKKIKWDKSKRLLTGSLILLTTVESSFNPHNTHFGVVFSRNTRELEKGILTVTWEGTPPVYDEDHEYFMLESEVYLEAYRYTLETLKSLELEKFPMKKFIVDAKSSVEAPTYLKNATKLLEVKLASGEDRYIAPLQSDKWPSANDFGLDGNQLEAFRAALTKEFTIIQGPPGTGKTFLGLKVAEVLLKNSALWEDPEGNPITVVCYTNHALDQFLEGILKYYKREDVPAEIIRIGGRCKSEDLATYSLREVRYRNKRKIPQSCYTAMRIARDEIDELEAERSNKMNEVTGLQDVQGIVDFEKLTAWGVIQPFYPKVLWNHMQKLSWLGIDEAQLNRDRLSAEHFVREWFQVRQFPKRQKKPSKTEVRQQQQVVQRSNLDAGEEDDDDDDEDYDLDELLDNRILLDDILLEAETSQKVNLGRRLCYLPDCSVYTCDKRMRQINRDLQAATKGMNMAQTTQVRETKRGELLVLENRRKILAEICKLYKEQLLDLPDVSDLLREIQGEGTVHYNRLIMAERWSLYFAIVEWSRRKVAESVAEHEKILRQRKMSSEMQYSTVMVKF